MRVHLPGRRYRCYAFVTEQTEFERAPKWEVGNHEMIDGVDHVNMVKKRIAVFSTVYAGIYGFSEVDKRDQFVRQCNTSAKMREIAHVCSPFSATVVEVV